MVSMSLDTNGCEKDVLDRDAVDAIEKEKEIVLKLEDSTPMVLDEVDEDTVCGLGSFRPKWFQKFATARCYVFLYSIIGILQGSYYAYLIGCVSTLEKRFAFKSKVTGVIMVIDEITPLLFGILVGYFGGKAHRPRMLAFGMYLSALCCFISAMPYFIYGPAQHLMFTNSSRTDVCDYERTTESCDDDDRPPTLAAVVFLLLGSFVKGFGNLAYYTIGLAYMDDNAKKKNTPIYFGFSFALRLLGPVTGFLMSSAFLKIYENPFENPGFGQDDPRWVGAWWMGFVLQGILLAIFTFPLMFFPRRLPSQSKPPTDANSHFEHEGFIQKIKGLFLGLKRLFSNKLYVYLAVGSVSSICGRFGHYMMLPKYMENQFRLSASNSSIYSGPPGLIALQISSLLGAIAIWKYRLGARALMLGITLTDILGLIMFLLMMIPSCPNMSFIGATSVGMELDLKNECNENCSCTTNVFTPLCGPDGVSTYFSSCHAGCSGSFPMDEQGNVAFANCSCVHGENGEFMNVEKMEKGFCQDESCWTQAIIYIIMMPITSAVTNIFWAGHTMILLRSINRRDKSFALGTFETMLCLFGFIPYPLIFGALTDSACRIWEFSCGKTGNCWVYDTHKLNYLLHAVSACFSFLSVLCNIRIFTLSGNLGDIYEEDDHFDDNKQQTDTTTDVIDTATEKRMKPQQDSSSF